jgi:hypothetical protein
VIRTLKKNADNAIAVFLKAVPKIAAMDWSEDVAAARVRALLLAVSRAFFSNGGETS